MHNLVANVFQERQLHLQKMTLPLYLPHHGVFHPCQPGKIRVVFDCSAEIRGISLNKELLPEPDLTSQFFKVLTKLSTE